MKLFNQCEEAAFENVAVMMLFVYSFACSIARLWVWVCTCQGASQAHSGQAAWSAALSIWTVFLGLSLSFLLEL